MTYANFKDKQLVDLAFKLYMEAVHGSNWDIKLSNIQLRETKFAFFAGFQECFAFMLKVSDEIPESDSMRIFEQVQNELTKFVEDSTK